MQNKALDHSCLSLLLRVSLCKENLLEHQNFSREINKLKSHAVTFQQGLEKLSGFHQVSQIYHKELWAQDLMF